MEPEYNTNLKVLTSSTCEVLEFPLMATESKNQLNFSSPQQQQQNRAVHPRSHEKDTCFRCKMLGHWAENCPNKPKGPASPSPVRGSDGLYYTLCVMCPRCGVHCEPQTSHPSMNPDRDYFTCPSKSCEYFKWAEDVKLVYVPICRCGAGACRLNTEKSGPHAGRKYFICLIKKVKSTVIKTSRAEAQYTKQSMRNSFKLKRGQGACDFFRWLDTEVVIADNDVGERISSPQSTLINWDEIRPANSDLVDIGGTNHPDEDNESLAVDALHCQSKRGKLMLMELERQEGTSNEPLQKHQKFQDGSVGVDGSVLDSTMKSFDLTQEKSMDSCTEKEVQASVLASKAAIHQRQVEFCKQISLAGNTSGGIASFDFISAPENVDVFNSEDSAFPPESNGGIKGNKTSPHSPPQRARPLSIPHWELSVPGILKGTRTADAVSEGFAQLAVNLQNELLRILEPMDFHDHESMVREATTVFAALDCLLIDCGPFRERVEELISCASSLAKISSSISKDQSCQKLVDLVKLRKTKLDDVSGRHVEYLASVEAARNRLNFLNDEASCIRNMLVEIETKLSCCKVENQNLETRFVQTSKDMVEAERNFEVASKTAEEALKLRQQREDELLAAKAAFQKAQMNPLNKVHFRGTNLDEGRHSARLQGWRSSGYIGKASKSKIGDVGFHILSKQYIGGLQVSVDILLGAIFV
ncbi:hypothetical protein RJ639_036370 [Escallonia herrerae]|uniref:CCHC-type domain-containing protein n=1 Tax=Escallonia herrerae TaxID=1293975 RepID=A0AA88WPG3_9ASTE|nr:hypothetical protein RJ639_036370 [Escallonia herrerae]